MYQEITSDNAANLLRIVGLEITDCCKVPAYYSQWNNNGRGVRQVCSKCGTKYRVSHDDFLEKKGFQVACPECKNLMTKCIDKDISNRYIFKCAACDIRVNAAVFLFDLSVFQS